MIYLSLNYPHPVTFSPVRPFDGVQVGFQSFCKLLDGEQPVVVWCDLDTDISGLLGFLCDGEALAALGVGDELESTITGLYYAALDYQKNLDAE